MNIKIYQINSDRDVNRVAFDGLDRLEKFVGTRDVDGSIYDKVYEGMVDCKSLEDVYHTFNMNRPPEFTGHSLSVSDVVEVVDSPKLVGIIDRADNLKIPYIDFLEYTQAQEFLRESGVDFEAHDYVGLNVPSIEKGFYFCDSFGFKKIDFDPAKTQEKDVKKFKVVLVEPEKEARVVELESDLRAMQHAVQGYIETIYPFEDEVAIVCNEEGKMIGLPLNRALYADGEMVEIVAGTFFVCSTPTESENFESLSDEQTNKYLEMFKEPERFCRGPGGRIHVEKIKRPLEDAIAEYKQSVSESRETGGSRDNDRDL